MNEKKYILAYGVLREGGWLYDFYHDVGEFNYIETTEQYGFNMFDLGNFPVVRATSSLNSDEITCDIIECSQETFEDIYEQQMRNGFYLLKIIRVIKKLQKSVPCYIFLWKNPVSDQYIVKGGDWYKHILKNKLKNEQNIKQEELELSFSRSNN